MRIARRSEIAPFIVMDVMQAAHERELVGGDVLHMEVGQPGTPAPSGVIAAAHKALEEDRIGYTLALGLPALRERISRHYQEFYGIDVPARRIVVTAGSSGAFLLAFLTLFDVGARVALGDPGYPAYRNILRILGIEPVCVPTAYVDRFQPTPESIEEASGRSDIDGVLVASPANPTGTMLGRDELSAIARFCREGDRWLISDEIYHGITYEKEAVTALEVDEEAVVINSFSKYFSMTGWRIGWMVVPDALVRPIERVAQNLFISVPTLSQYAAIAAFDCHDELKANVARYAENRALLMEALPAAGLRDFAPPDGAFYLYADVAHLTNDSEAFCRQMLNDTGVAATPGIDFDEGRGRRYLRFSFAGAKDDMAEAAGRLQRWLNRAT